MDWFVHVKNLTTVLLFLLGIFLPRFGATAESKIDLSVVYRAPRLSVEAHGVSLSRVLREIGAQVGFVIEEKGTIDIVVNLSIYEATIEEVLERLLTGQSYALMRRDDGAAISPQGAGISKIFLLGPGNNVLAGSLPRVTDRDNGPATFGRPDELEIARSYSAPPSLPTARPPDRISSEREPGPEPVVDDLLIKHALSGLGGAIPDPAAQSVTNIPQPPQRSPLGTAVSTPVLAGDTDSLAKMTLAAQQNLKALVDGLTTVTESLFRSLPSEQK